MQKTQVTWDEIIEKFDNFECKLTKDINDSSLESFFRLLQEDFTNNKFEKVQIEEAKKRTEKIIIILDKLKADLQQKTIDLMEHSTKLVKYIKTPNAF